MNNITIKTSMKMYLFLPYSNLRQLFSTHFAVLLILILTLSIMLMEIYRHAVEIRLISKMSRVSGGAILSFK
jgi:hypothetical protein